MTQNINTLEYDQLEKGERYSVKCYSSTLLKATNNALVYKNFFEQQGQIEVTGILTKKVKKFKTVYESINGKDYIFYVLTFITFSNNLYKVFIEADDESVFTRCLNLRYPL